MKIDTFESSAKSIGNALCSLYQVIVLVEDATSLCHIIDCDDDLRNLLLTERMSFDRFLECIYKNIHPASREDFQILSDTQLIHDHLSRKLYISEECQLRDDDSRYQWVRITICNAQVEGSPKGQEYLFLIQNIQKEKQKELDRNSNYVELLCNLQNEYDRLFIENMTDAQTGCFNRKGLNYYETKATNKAKEKEKALFVCVLDLNGLKFLNDTYGHAAGDNAIKAVSDALKASVPDLLLLTIC